MFQLPWTRTNWEQLSKHFWGKEAAVIRLKLYLELFMILRNICSIIVWKTRFHVNRTTISCIKSCFLVAVERILLKQEDLWYHIWTGMVRTILNQCDKTSSWILVCLKNVVFIMLLHQSKTKIRPKQWYFRFCASKKRNSKLWRENF